MDSAEAQLEEAPFGGEPVVEASAAGPTATDANVDAELLWSTVHTAVSSPFPRRLYRLLETEDPAIISWNEDGASFRVNDAALFSSEILPKYFRHSKITSFQRQLNLYGFTLASRSALAGSYQHPLFHKGREDTLDSIRRTPKKRSSSPSRGHGDHDSANSGHAAAQAAAAMGGLLMPGGLMGGNGSHLQPGGFPNPNDPNGLASMMMWPSLYQYQAAFQQQQQLQQQQQQQQQQHMQQHQQQHPSFQHMPPGFFPPGMPGVPPMPEGSTAVWGASGYGLEGGAQGEEGKAGAAAGGGEGGEASSSSTTAAGEGEGASEAHADQPQGTFPPSLMLPTGSGDPKEASMWAMPPPETLLPPPVGLLPPHTLTGSTGGDDGEQGAAKRLKSSGGAEELEQAFSPSALAVLDSTPFEPLAARLAASFGYGRALALALAVAAKQATTTSSGSSSAAPPSSNADAFVPQVPAAPPAAAVSEGAVALEAVPAHTPSTGAEWTMSSI